MQKHLAEIVASGAETPAASLKWRAKATEIIREHRPWTLDGEIECLLNICIDIYSLGLEDARDYINHIVSDNMGTEPKVFKTIVLGSKTEHKNNFISPPDSVDRILGGDKP